MLDCSIDGWFSESDAKAYAELASQIPHGGILVEVGVWLGRSIASISDICKQRDIRVVAVDTWRGSEEHVDIDKTRLYERFIENMARCDMLFRITPIMMPSVDAARLFQSFGLRANLVFIDASHDYSNVKADIAAWRSLTDVISGHDFSPGYCGVPNAVSESFSEFTHSRHGSCVWSACCKLTHAVEI